MACQSQGQAISLYSTGTACCDCMCLAMHVHDVCSDLNAQSLICRDPSGSMIAFADMMRKQIVMPAHLMDDNEHGHKTGRNLFKDFSSVAQATGTYTGKVCNHKFSQRCVGNKAGYCLARLG